MLRQTISIAAVLLGWTATQAVNKVLLVGDPAPRLVVEKFIKGKPVNQFEKGKIYVLEFWATWCPPCREAVPHLTALQKKYKDVVFIGVSVSQKDPEDVVKFVKKMGDQMDYRVALDDVSQPKHKGGVMLGTWMDAAGRDLIPAAFIVSGDGRIAWIGHPTQMDEPLEKIVAGKWDVDVAAKEYKEGRKAQLQLPVLRQMEAEAKKSNDPKKLLEIVEKAIGKDAEREAALGYLKFMVLFNQPNGRDKALEYGKHLADTVLNKDAEGLNDLAKLVVYADIKVKPDDKLIQFAVSIALWADVMSLGCDCEITDTLARAYYLSGDAARAVETQERAVKQNESSNRPDPAMKKRLEEYKKAAKKK